MKGWVAFLGALALVGGCSPAGPVVDVFLSALGVLATFEFNGNARDSSGNGRDALLIGGEFVPTAWGQGLHVLPGGPTGIDWSAFANLLVFPYTVEIVLTPQDTTDFRKLFSFDDTVDMGWYYYNEGISAYPEPEVGVGQVLAGERHYIAFVSTALDVVDIYFQGAFLGTSGATFTTPPPPPQVIFFRDDVVTDREEQLDAVVEALRISGVTRTPAEIAAVQQRLESPNP
ncbi:MAG: hypothetical protein HY335_01510 [Deinococcus sp.]|nr:hypothetical protein [Deinococcus sp.]